jgi:hypothetical protein
MMVHLIVALSLFVPADSSAVYVRRPDESRYPGHVQRIEVFVASEKTGAQRIAVRFHHEKGAFAFLADGPSATNLLRGKRDFQLARYVFVSGNGLRLRFQEQFSDKPVLPFSFTLQPNAILPVCLGENGHFVKQTNFLWDTFTLVEGESTQRSPEIGDAKVVALSDDLLVGTSRNFRNVNAQRIAPAEFAKDENLDYTYRPLAPHDLARMLASGFNYFDRVLPEQLEFLMDKPVWFDLLHFNGDTRPLFPEILFHPGFLGVEDFLDEPAYIFSEDFEPPSGVSPEEMARLQEKRTQAEWNRAVRGRQPGLVQLLHKAGVRLNGGDLMEPPFPIWEEFYSTACYQLHAPVSGFIHEGRYQHPETIDLLNYAFRTRLPRRPETMFRFYFAFLRGAARVFNTDWGMSIYGQATPATSLLGMTMAYDRGARWIYFWSSDRGHHLPFEEQLTLAKGLSEHIAAHPRPPRCQLIHAADDAVVLPFGFTFEVSDWQKSALPGLWHRSAFPVETGAMDDGTPYYSVLRCAAEEVQQLISDEREFDIVIDVPELKAAHYANLHDVLPRARFEKYEFLWSVRRPYYIALAGLTVFLIVFRTYRIIRWVRRRRTLAA